MSCMLRVFGNDLNLDGLLSQIKIKPHRIWLKGEADVHGNILQQSVASFNVSDADMNDFKTQSDEACNFLEEHCSDILMMVKFSGAEGVILDFGIELRDALIHSDFLPPRLIKAAAMTDIEIELSHYPCTKDNES